LFADPAAFAALIESLIVPLDSIPIDVVAGIDALGFVLGTAIAARLQRGFIPIRKHGKLPVAASMHTFRAYSQVKKGLEVRTGSITLGMRILVVDDWIETGAPAQEAIEFSKPRAGSLSAWQRSTSTLIPLRRDCVRSIGAQPYASTWHGPPSDFDSAPVELMVASTP